MFREQRRQGEVGVGEKEGIRGMKKMEKKGEKGNKINKMETG